MSGKRRKIDSTNYESEHKNKPNYDYENIINHLYIENISIKKKLLELDKTQSYIVNEISQQIIVTKKVEELIFNIHNEIKNILEKISNLENNKPLLSYIN
jgi:hypothetical protein